MAVEWIIHPEGVGENRGDISRHQNFLHKSGDRTAGSHPTHQQDRLFPAAQQPRNILRMLPPIQNDYNIVLLTHQRLVHNIQKQFGLARTQRPGFYGDL